MQIKVPVTVRPYATTRRDEDWKISTVAATPMNMISVITGTLICPRIVFEVWTIGRRGRSPICIACWASEYMPEITACEAITVATVASTTIGSISPSGTSA